MGTDEPTSFGELLRRYRVAAGLTQEELAERAGLSPRGVSDLERGARRRPHPETLRRLAETLELSDSERAVLIAARSPLPPSGLSSDRRTELPLPLTSFVGREREVAEVRRLLETTRLVTLTGTGGVGKTRLGLRVAASLLDVYADGVWLTELGPLSDPALVPHAVGLVLGVREQPGQPLIKTLAGVLSRSSVLIVLDNCEHVVNACAELTERLLRACPRLGVLATSREPLGVPGEVTWRVPSLAVPDTSGQMVSVEELVHSDAVRLFIERATAALPGFTLSDANASDVVRICRQLDGVPLAIELAAVRTRMLSPGEIAARLDDRFSLLVGGSRTTPPRQQTLLGTVSWSYDLLSAAERRLFERLSLFAGSFSLRAAEALCPEQAGPEVLDLLSRLVDRSLVVAEPWLAGEDTRYRLLETLRAYAWERLSASGQADLIRRRQADWLIDMAEQADAAFHGPEQGRWLRWAECEHANGRVVLQWLIEVQDTQRALRLVAALWWAWMQQGRWTECRAWLDPVLALPGAAERTRLRGRVLGGAGALATIGGGDMDVVAGRRWLEESLSIGLEFDEPWTVMNARSLLSLMAGMRGEADLAELERSAIDALAYARQAGNAWGENRSLAGSGEIALRRGNLELASARLEEAIRVARAAGDVWSLAMTLNAVGDLERGRGEHSRAGARYEESLALFAELRLADQQQVLLHNLGYVALAAGNHSLAATRFMGAARAYQRLGDRRGISECLLGLGATAAAGGRYADAVRLFASGEAGLQQVHAELWHSNRTDYEHWQGVARAGLDAAAFDRAWAEGLSLALDEVLALALS